MGESRRSLKRMSFSDTENSCNSAWFAIQRAFIDGSTETVTLMVSADASGRRQFQRLSINSSRPSSRCSRSSISPKEASQYAQGSTGWRNTRTRHVFFRLSRRFPTRTCEQIRVPANERNDCVRIRCCSYFRRGRHDRAETRSDRPRRHVSQQLLEFPKELVAFKKGLGYPVDTMTALQGMAGLSVVGAGKRSRS